MKRKHLIFFMVCCLMLQPAAIIAKERDNPSKKALPMEAADRSIQQFDREWVHYQNEWELLMKLSVKNKDIELAKKLNQERNDSLAKLKDKRTEEKKGELQELLEKYQAELKTARKQLTSPPVRSFAAAKAVSVASSVDLYEPNDEVSQASSVSAGNSIESYLYLSLSS